MSRRPTYQIKENFGVKWKATMKASIRIQETPYIENIDSLFSRHNFPERKKKFQVAEKG